MVFFSLGRADSVNPDSVLRKPWFTTYGAAQTQQAMTWEAFPSSLLPNPARASLELSMVLQTSSPFASWPGHRHSLIKLQQVNTSILFRWTVEDPLPSAPTPAMEALDHGEGVQMKPSPLATISPQQWLSLTSRWTLLSTIPTSKLRSSSRLRLFCPLIIAIAFIPQLSFFYSWRVSLEQSDTLFKD